MKCSLYFETEWVVYDTIERFRRSLNLSVLRRTLTGHFGSYTRVKMTFYRTLVAPGVLQLLKSKCKENFPMDTESSREDPVTRNKSVSVPKVIILVRWRVVPDIVSWDGLKSGNRHFRLGQSHVLLKRSPSSTLCNPNIRKKVIE